MKRRLSAIVIMILVVVSSVVTLDFFQGKADAQLDPYDASCAAAAAGNANITGFGRFPNTVTLFPGQTALTIYRTYVCNGTPAQIRDWTFTSCTSEVLETGRTGVLDFSPTGWSGPDANCFYTQDMGTFDPHEWRRQDVNMGVAESAFDGPGSYTIRVSGKGRVWNQTAGCFYPDPSCYGETNTIVIDLDIEIRRPQIDCANIVISPDPPQVGQAFSVTTSYIATDGSINSAYQLAAFMTAPTGAITGGGNVGYTVVNPNTLRYTFPPFTDSGGGSYNITTTLSVPGVTWFDPIVCNAGFTISLEPYHHVYGGDVHVGAGFGASCTVDPGAAIFGFNRGTGPFEGAGSQLAVYALGTIEEFTSGRVRNPNDSNHLSFASSSTFGGGLNPNYTACAPDFFEYATGTLTGDVNIAGRNVALGDKQTIYVDGNATITGNITFAGGSYANKDQIPSFKLIVRGNIYVAPGVSRLDGVYVAQPNGANGGRFYTCWPGNIPTGADLNGPCHSRLTVYGAVLAETIKFTRTLGTLSQASAGERYNTAYAAGAGPAEIFIFSPEVWLAGELTSINRDIDSINFMPPIL